jgi:capsular polysaccharide biosynthesis protein
VHSTRFILFLGILFAAFSSLALGFVADFLDPSIRTPQELRNARDIPVLAAIPREAA